MNFLMLHTLVNFVTNGFVFSSESMHEMLQHVPMLLPRVLRFP
jgi:hypothetical protein